MLTGIRQSEEIAKLRKTLEEERVALKQQQKAHQTTITADGFSLQPAAIPENSLKTGLGLPRKSSMKDVTGRLSNLDAGNTQHGEDQDRDVCNHRSCSRPEKADLTTADPRQNGNPSST